LFDRGAQRAYKTNMDDLFQSNGKTKLAYELGQLIGFRGPATRTNVMTYIYEQVDQIDQRKLKVVDFLISRMKDG